MRAALLLALLLLPTASAWTLEASPPATAPAGLPLPLDVCVTGPANASAELKAQLTLGGRTLAGSARYGDAFPLGPAGRACREVVLDVADETGNATLVLRVRPAERDGATAEWEGVVALVRAPAPPLRIAAVYGPPYEGVVLANDGDAAVALLGLSLAQGTRAGPLPNVTLDGGARLFLGGRAPPDQPARALLDADLRAGDLTLLQGRRAIDTLAVPSLSAGTLVDEQGARTMGRTQRDAPVFRTRGPILAYATPDAGAWPVVDLLDGAEREVLLTGYTMTSEDVAAALLRAVRRGVDVRILLEGAPVGGVPDKERALLATLAGAGARVDVLRSTPDFPTRYRTVHAKVIVADEARVLVATENLQDSSYPPLAGAAGSRGYGLVVEDADVARFFAGVFHADAGAWPDVQRVDPTASPAAREPVPAAGATRGPAHLEPAGARVRPILAPDTSDVLLDAIASASSSVDVAMLFAEPDWAGEPNPFLDALLAAARRGVTIRLLLDGNVDAGRNAATVAALQGAAEAEALPLEARVDDAARTLHAKMVLLDGESAYVGSMNWGRASARDNREAGLLVESASLVAFLGATFEGDWTEEAPAIESPADLRVVPAPALLAVAGVALAGLIRPWGLPPRRRRRGA